MGIHTLYRLTLLLAALILCFSIVSCGRGHRRSTSTTGTDTQNSAAEGNITPAENTQPVFKPFPIMPEGDYPKLKVRKASALEFSVTGADKVASVGYANRIDENDPNTDKDPVKFLLT